MSMLGDMLRRDRERCAFTVGQVAWRLGVTASSYRDLEAGAIYPDYDTYERICDLYGWPQSFASPSRTGGRQ